LPKIKNLLKKLDVPKRMVQIDVLLVEKKMTDRKQVGINLLNINNKLSVPHETGISFQTEDKKPNKGLLQFLFQRPPGKFPGIDLTYNFLLAQDDLRINANPTVLAVNQTAAQISIVEEISINNGAVQHDSKSASVEKSYTRAQYGTTIVMMPTIHLPNPDDPDKGFVSLHTDVTFDSTPCSYDDRPPVTRRHVTNDVQIADGETVILGGLRRKNEENAREKIPFLGDLPGIGKLFGSTKSADTNTEMFIFITPHIIHDPVDDLQRIRLEECRKRPGDIPEFLVRLDEAKEKEKQGLFASSIKMLFDGT
jgi:general secretion pathway protein D